MCTARSGMLRTAAPTSAALAASAQVAAAVAASKLAESAPPLKATTNPVEPLGIWASRPSRREAAEKVMGSSLRFAERTECAQPCLARIEQLGHREIAQLREVLEHALLDGLCHGLRVTVCAAVRLLQD